MPSYLSPGVYVEEVSSGSRPIQGVGTSVAAFVGFAEKGPVDEPVLISNWTQYAQTFGEFIEGSYLAHSVYGYFLNGGGVCYVVRIGAEEESSNGEVKSPVAKAALPAASGDGKQAFVVQAIEAGTAGDNISVEVADSGSDSDTFKLIVKQNGQVKETIDGVSTKRGPNYVATAVKQQSKLITVEDVKGAQLAVPSPGEMKLKGGDAPTTALVPVVSADKYIGSTADRTGFAGLEAIDEVTMLAVPDLMAAYEAGAIDEDGVKAVQLAMIAHCELMSDRVAILDTPPDLNAQRVKEWRTDVTGYDSKYATMYWPWVKVMNPSGGQPLMTPPSGHIAGVWARSDSTRGVHKAPANEVVRGVISLETNITKGEHDQLNPIAVNVIRSFPGQGIRVWGARTLTSDPEWRYLNVRRLFNYIEESILLGTSWVVFEPNDYKLWDAVSRTITMFLRTVWRDGALFGRTPEEAFFVKCDEENNPPEMRDQGILTVEVGVAPVKPAEFVVFRISQYAEGGSLSE